MLSKKLLDRPFILNSIEELRTKRIPSGVETIHVLGYYTANDGAGGIFYPDTSDTSSSDNNGTVIVGFSSIRYKRVFDRSKPRDVRWFGARCDRTTDDTAAINACLATIPSGGGTILIPDGAVSGNLTHSSNGWIQIHLEGTWRLKEPLVLDRKVHIVGITTFDSGGTQFQMQSAASIAAHSTFVGDILIKVVSAGGVTLESIHIYHDGTCLYLGHPDPTDPNASGSVANMYVRKCGIQSYSGNPSIIVDSVFWLQITDCAINNVKDTPPDYAIEFRHSLWQGSYTGLVRIKNTTTTGGFRFVKATGGPVVGFSSFVFEDVAYELASGPFITIEDGVNLGCVAIVRSGSADELTTGLPTIKVGANCAVGSFYIRESFSSQPLQPFIEAQSPIPGLVIDNFNSIVYYGAGYDTGYDDPNYPALISGTGVLTGPVESVYRMGFHSIPSDVVVMPVNTDPTSWAVSNASVTLTKAPDGTNTAGLLTPSGGGTSSVSFVHTGNMTNSSLTAGDYLILGGWLNNIDFSGFGINFDSVAQNVVFPQSLVSNLTNNYWTWNTQSDQRYVERGNYWVPFGFAIKVVSVSTGGITLRASMNNFNTPKALWQPFLLRIPASANYSRKEISKLLAAQLRNIHPNNLPGYIGISSTQKFDAGSELLLSGITGKPKILGGTTNPEGSIAAPPGSLYTMTDGSTAALYFKASGTGNTGWVLK